MPQSIKDHRAHQHGITVDAMNGGCAIWNQALIIATKKARGQWLEAMK